MKLSLGIRAFRRYSHEFLAVSTRCAAFSFTLSIISPCRKTPCNVCVYGRTHGYGYGYICLHNIYTGVCV